MLKANSVVYMSLQLTKTPMAKTYLANPVAENMMRSMDHSNDNKLHLLKSNRVLSIAATY